MMMCGLWCGVCGVREGGEVEGHTITMCGVHCSVCEVRGGGKWGSNIQGGCVGCGVVYVGYERCVGKGSGEYTRTVCRILCDVYRVRGEESRGTLTEERHTGSTI